MSKLFNVKVRYVRDGDIILPEDHNNCVEAVKEIADVALRIIEYLKYGAKR